MELFVSVVVGVGQALLNTLQIAMLVRAVLSWFPLREDNPFVMLIHMVTEPVVAPIRALFDRFGWFRDIPIDISFLVAWLLLSGISTTFSIFL